MALADWQFDVLMVPGDALSLVDLVAMRPAWMADAACLEHPEVEFVPRLGRSEANADAARAICAGCLCRADCLGYALADESLLGIWAGTTTAERRELRRMAA